MSEQLNERQVEDYRQAFTFLDRDSNGAISSAEFGNVMKGLGHTIPDQVLPDVIREADIDGNGSLDFSEFLRMMLRKLKMNEQDEEFRVAFNVFDRNQDGYITADELRIILGSLGEKVSEAEAAELIRECDADGDGRIDLQEFMVMMTAPIT